jgi:hypothetical protein
MRCTRRSFPPPSSAATLQYRHRSHGTTSSIARSTGIAPIRKCEGDWRTDSNLRDMQFQKIPDVPGDGTGASILYAIECEFQPLSLLRDTRPWRIHSRLTEVWDGVGGISGQGSSSNVLPRCFARMAVMRAFALADLGLSAGRDLAVNWCNKRLRR